MSNQTCNFDLIENFNQIDKINKINESDQTESFDQSDDFYQINNFYQIDKFLRQVFLSSFFFENAYKTDCQMQNFTDKISKFLFLRQEYQHDQQNNF